MRNRKGIAALIVLMIVIIVSLYLFFLWALGRNTEMRDAPKSADAEKIAESEEARYSIPANAIPSADEIERSIVDDEKKSEDTKKIQQQILKKTAGREEERKISPAQGAKEPSGAPEIAVKIPQKKEVVFPTYEERKANESKTGYVAY